MAKEKILPEITKQKISSALSNRKLKPKILRTYELKTSDQKSHVKIVPHLLHNNTACLLIYSNTGFFSLKNIQQEISKNYEDILKTYQISKSENYKIPIRKTIPKKVRKEILESFNYQCAHCGSRENLTIDHILPVSLYGGNEKENLQVLCRSCNSKKGNANGGEQIHPHS